MTDLFKCLVLVCAVSVVLSFTDVRDDVPWFKNGERIKNKFVTGVVNGIVDADCSDGENGSTPQGECMSKLECTNSGGRPGSPCSLMGFCCVVQKTCGETTTNKVSYFVPPKKLQSVCTLNVKRYSNNVCQIRLDFEKFELDQPTQNNKKAYMCEGDGFSVGGLNRYLGFSRLCGKNTGQHIYIPVDKTQNQITLKFNLDPRTTEEGKTWKLAKPDWKIKITQLECHRWEYENFLSAPSKLMAIHNNLKNKKSARCSDCDLIAPPGCLQYHRNDTGTFESFNYNEGKGPYIGGLAYAICFRQTSYVCGAKYTIQQLKMNKNGEGGEKICHAVEEASDEKSQDYIRISEGKYDSKDSKYKDHYCDEDKDTGITDITAKPYEPLYVGVHTDKFRPNHKENEENQELGFRISYRLLTDDCER